VPLTQNVVNQTIGANATQCTVAFHDAHAQALSCCTVGRGKAGKPTAAYHNVVACRVFDLFEILHTVTAFF
jgi:hypothetical protein